MRGSPLIPSMGMAKLQLSSVVFNAQLFAKLVSVMSNTAPTPGGIKRGPRPTFVVAGEGSQGEGESKHPFPVRVFGDFLRVEKVTPRSDRQLVATKSHIQNAAVLRPPPAQRPAVSPPDRIKPFSLFTQG